MPKYNISGTVYYADGFDFEDIEAPNEDTARREAERRIESGDLTFDPQLQEICIECVTETTTVVEDDAAHARLEAFVEHIMKDEDNT